MVDFRRICYLLKSPDFDRKVGGHAPDYPTIFPISHEIGKHIDVFCA